MSCNYGLVVAGSRLVGGFVDEIVLSMLFTRWVFHKSLCDSGSGLITSVHSWVLSCCSLCRALLFSPRRHSWIWHVCLRWNSSWRLFRSEWGIRSARDRNWTIG